MHQIVFAKRADKTLRKMPRNVANLIREKLNQIAANPYAQHNNVTQLRGRPGYRLRVGDWRVIYEIDDNELTILAVRIGARGAIYR